MDDTDILSMAGSIGFTCDLTDPDGYDLDEYSLEEVLKIDGVEFGVKMKLDLFAKTCSDVQISYKYRKKGAGKVMDALSKCMKAVDYDLMAFEAKGYTIKA